MKSLTDVLNMEQSVQKMLSELKSQLYAAVRQSPLGCATPIDGPVKQSPSSFPTSQRILSTCLPAITFPNVRLSWLNVSLLPLLPPLSL